jgi:tetratricopeptide (TPR) repeat protein
MRVPFIISRSLIILFLSTLISFSAISAEKKEKIDNFKEPKNIAAFNKEAGKIFGKGDWVGAAKYTHKYGGNFKAPKKEDKKDYENYKSARVWQGWAKFVLNDYYGSLAIFEEVNKLKSEKPEDNFNGYLGLAWNNIKLNNFKKGKEYANKALEVGKKEHDWGAYDALAWIAIKEQRYDDALEFVKQGDRATLSKWKVKLKDSAITEGWVNVFKNDWDAATKAWKSGLERDPKCFYCRDGMARFYISEASKALAKKEKEKAKEFYAKALKEAVSGARATRHNSGLVTLVDTALYGLGDKKETIKTYTSLTKKWKTDPLYFAKLGYAHLYAKDYKSAELNFNKAIKKQPGYYLATSGLSAIKFTKRDIVKDGWSLYYKGKYKDQQKVCEGKKEAAVKKNNPAALDCIGWSLLAQQKYSESATAFKEALKIDPYFYFSSSGLSTAQRYQLVNYTEAWSLINVGSFDRAEERLKKAEAKVDADLKFLMNDARAWIKFYKKDYSNAKKDFESIIKTNDKAYGSYKGLAYIAMEKKDFNTAADQLTKSLNFNPYQPLADYIFPVNKMQKAGQWEKSKYILELGQRIYPYSADIQFLLAKAYKELKDVTTAETKLIIAAGLAPAYIEPVMDKVGLPAKNLTAAYYAVALNSYYRGKFKTADKRFAQYFKNGGNFYAAYNGNGLNKLYLKKYSDAEAQFKKALEVRKAAKGFEKLEYLDAEAYSGLGWANYNQDKFGEAKKYFDTALKKWPGYIKANSGLNTLQYRKRDIVKDGWKIYYEAFKEKTAEGAKAKYEAALKSCTAQIAKAEAARNPAAQDCVGWMNIALDNSTAAKTAFETALKIDKSFWYSSSGLIQAKRSGYTLYNKAFYLANSSLYIKEEDKKLAQLNKALALFKQSREEITEKEWKWLVDDGEAWVAYYKKDYATAKSGFTKVIKSQPKAYLSFRGLSYVAAAEKKWDEAGKNLFKSLSLAPYQGAAIYSFITKELIENEKFKTAKDILEFGEKVYPYSGDIQFLLARTYMGLKDNDKGTKKALIATALAPAYIDTVYDDLQIDAKKSIDAYYNMGWGTYFARNNEQAIKRFDQYLKNGGKSKNAERGKAFALFRMKKDAEAKPILEAMIELEDEKKLLPITEVVPIPNTKNQWTVVYDSRSTLGWLHFRNKDYDQATKYFTETIDKYPFLIDALTGMGYVKLEQNDKAGAKKYFQDALKLSPYYPDAKAGLKKAS